MTSINLDPQNIPLVSIDFMNRTHEEEVALVVSIQEIINSFETGSDNAVLSEKLAYWLEHTEGHFQRENELMQETGFPAYPMHSEEHNNALNQMQSVVRAWQENQDIDMLKDYVFVLWPNWFKNHVNTMDTVTAEFALMHGFTEAS